MKLSLSYQGHQNKNLPIRSSFFRGSKFAAKVGTKISENVDQPVFWPSGSGPGGHSNNDIDRSLLLATGE